MPGPPIGGCDPPQPANIATVAQRVAIKRLTRKAFVAELLAAWDDGNGHAIRPIDARDGLRRVAAIGVLGGEAAKIQSVHLPCSSVP